MTACTICGKENPAGADYCEDCGAALTTTTGAPATAESAPGEAQGSAPTPAGSPPFTPEEAAPPAPAELSMPVPAGATDPAPAEAPAPAPLANPRLVAKRYGAVTTEEIPLQAERLVVGRFDPESGPVDIDLSNSPESGQLSRHHAEIYREADGQWHVKDLGSTNGVFVKRPDSSIFGPRITTPAALNPGDEVAFGNARFVFRAD
jgi:FHA domain